MTRQAAAFHSGDAAPVTSSAYPPPFAARVAGRTKRVLGAAFGIEAFGVNLVTLAPGAQSSLRHRHTVQEEFVFILEGELVLVLDDGESVLGPGMCAGFVPGGSAHHLVNRSAAPASFLVVGDRRAGDAADYPDDDLVAVHLAGGGGGRWQFAHKDGTPYP